MRTEITQELLEKIPMLSDEKQKALLNYVEKLLEFEDNSQRKTPLELWRELSKDIPSEEFDKLPTDGSINHDHYLYGAPKK